MSGGHFNYDQYKIRSISDEIKTILEKQGELIEDSYYTYSDGFSTFPTYPQEIQEKFKEAIYYLRKAEIYAQRVDYLVSGDDNEESFLERLTKQLQQLDQEFFPPKNNIISL